MSYFKDFKVNTDNASGDAFGRLRVGEPHTIFDSKQVWDNDPLLWDDAEISGSGTTSTHDADRASTDIAVSGATAGNRVRQTFQRFNYQPGKSQLVLMTFILDKTGGGAGITRSVGMFDDENGIYLKDDAGTYKVGIRSFVTGAAVDTEVAQSSWNLDVMDGTGNSGITIDFTKTNILVMDMEWLGVGRVRIGFNINGATIYVHEFLNANTLAAVYMTTPNLPLRYEIDNGGAGAASSIESICASVMSEGGTEDTGILRYDSTAGTHVNANTANIIYGVVGMRLKTAYKGVHINLVRATMLNSTNDDYEVLIILNPTVAGTPSFSGLTNSAIETSKGATANTVTGGTVFDGAMVNVTGGGGSIDLEARNAVHLGEAIDGTRDEIWLCVRPLSSNADVEGSITWRELL